MVRLHIGEKFSFPLEFITQTQAILAIKRIGKTYTASVQAEELLKAHQQVVAIDITGAWWGLRSSADGRGVGYPILIAGGDHGDIPLEETAGHILAEAVVSERFSAIIDLSLMRKGQAHRFLADFFETLYRKNRDAMHLFCDEADFYAPQRPWGDEARTLGAMSDIVRRGGIRGIGCTLITQRPAVLNKDVLTQCGILTCLRISHPRDMVAIREWVDVHSTREQADEMMKSLPSLPKGSAWVWAPGWPTEEGIFERIQVRKRTTFDSGATPKAGELQKAPKVIAEVDIKKLGAQIAATAERILENDPKALKRKIAELEKKTKAGALVVDETATQAAIDKAVASQARAYTEQIQVLEVHISKLNGVVSKAHAILSQTIETPKLAAIPAPIFTSAPISVPTRKPTPARTLSNGTGVKLPTGEQATLIAVGGYSDGIARDTISVLTGYAKSSRDAYIYRLRERGYVESNGSLTVITQAGIDALGSNYEPLPTGKDLQDHWMGKLPEGEKKVLAVLIEQYPRAVQRPSIDEATGYAKSSRDAYIYRLRARRLLVSADGGVRASEDLFN